MTDFGANIFDDKQPPAAGGQPPKAKPGARGKKAKATAETPAAPPVPAPAAAAPADASPAAAADGSSPAKKPRAKRARKAEAEAAAPVPVAEPDTQAAEFGFVTFPDAVDAPRQTTTVPTQAAPTPAAPTPETGEPGPRTRTPRPAGKRRAPRDDDQSSAADAPPAAPPAATDGPPRRTAAPRTRSRQVAVLIDLQALQDEARQQGGELALTRLGAALAAGRPVHQALSFQAGKRAPVGFAAQPTDGQAPISLLQKAAFDLAKAARSEGSGLVLAPASDAMLALASELRAAGANVELAGFVVRDDQGQPTERLPRGCLFVP